MKLISEWFRQKREAKTARAYRDGYDWAAGRLLRHDRDSESIRNSIGITSDQFDRGALDACQIYDKLLEGS